MTTEARKWLVDARKIKSLTQESLANEVGISRTSYVRYEKGERTPKPITAKKIAALLDIDKSKFFWD